MSIKLQTTKLENTTKPGSSAIYRNGEIPEILYSLEPEKIKTVYDLFARGLELSPHRECLGRRPYNIELGQRDNLIWQTYIQISDRIDHFGSGLMHIMQKHAINTSKIGIWSTNRPEWTITDLACASQGLCNIALYETLGPETMQYIINHAELEIIVCSSKYLRRLLEMKHNIPSLSVIILMDTVVNDPLEKLPDGVQKGEIIQAWADEKRVTLLDFEQVEAMGIKYPREHRYSSPEDIACIMYTSGTTGTPKGVMLTHANFVSAVTATVTLFKTNADEVGVSYLPLAHCFGRVYDLTILASGGKLGYLSGGIESLLDDCQAIQPTMFVAVPRLLNRIYSKLAQASIFAKGITGSLFRMAVASKLRSLANGDGCYHPIWDRLLFNKMRRVLGGAVRIIGSGAAPLSPDVLQFLRVVLCCDIREGYGATETTAASCLQRMGDNNAGSVGGPYTCNEIKLVNVPEMECFTDSHPPKGEICMRGPNIFKGYYKDQEQTDQVVDSDGWYHSGDIGTIDQEGSIQVVDRKKNIFKLAQGEYIAPEKIENVYIKNPIIAQIFIDGDPLQNALIAVVVPDLAELTSIAKSIVPENELSNVEGLYHNEKVKNAVLQQMVHESHGLCSFEIPKAIYLESSPFTVEKDLLTPTLKVKRHQAKQYYATQIAAMYASLSFYQS
ncbi:hypothetical protein [Parasitella parasitica]|uniref:AMP-dependent synthetase/ligase domain-containing protein n=1 Tax=Parasitella parasitica TaxID=35722 RepID=A0A0B7NGT6_9FUNG|nr:hypothetical protein [Parasitella parasitica]